MRIGISVVPRPGQNIWESGLGQNIVFLAECLAGIAGVERVLFLNCGDHESLPPQAGPDNGGFDLLWPREATDLIDVALEVGGVLDLEWTSLLRARGGKVVFLCCGQPYAVMAEPNVFNRDAFGARPDRFDEVWHLPKDRGLAEMLRLLHRCEVREAPYLWSPAILERSIAQAKGAGRDFGFAPVGEAEFRVAIFEPNISVLKCGIVPMLITDEAYRRDGTAIGRMNVLNSLHMVNQTTFNFLAHALQIEKDGKALFLAREEFAPFMAAHADVVVSHQWENDQNYLYLDALWGGYPLVHNSPWIADLGYYYPEFAIRQGAERLLEAVRGHAAGLQAYKARARRFIAGLAPEASANRDAYARLLIALGAEARPRP